MLNALLGHTQLSHQILIFWFVLPEAVSHHLVLYERVAHIYALFVLLILLLSVQRVYADALILMRRF